MNSLPDYPALGDARLVELHLSGDAAAFRQIVDRYKSMVSAVAYNFCGDLARSEELAQDVFVTAWKQISDLREPEKLRGWLAGIARNASRSFLRRESRLVSGHTEALSSEMPAEESDPRQQAITADEAALMWRALADIEETYREPMILFYREQRSTQAVAETLGLSEDNVRQRLSRGRSMLTARMAALVEETLARSAPTVKLTNAVMLALPITLAPMAGTVVTAKTVGSGGGAVAKGGLLVKLSAVIGVLPALFSGLSDYWNFRARQRALAPDQQKQVEREYLVMKISFAVMVVLLVTLFGFFGPVVHLRTGGQALLFSAIVGVAAWLGLRAKARLDRVVKTSGRPSEGFEYRSPETLFGAPILHVRVGQAEKWRAPAVRAWIALSDTMAVGRLLAFAPVAIAPVALGGVTAGAFALGGAALGLGSIGWISAGGLTEGAVAFGWVAARGGFMGVARDYAQGLIASAAHANDAISRAYFSGHDFFQFSNHAWHWAFWAGWFVWLPPLVMVLWAKRNSRA